MKNTPDQRGFTVIELMVATTVFAVLVLLTSMAVVQIGRQFYKGIITARAQNAARTLTDEISRNVQYTATPPRVRTSGNVIAICTAEVEYIIDRGQVQQGGVQRAMRYPACSSPLATLPSSGALPQNWPNAADPNHRGSEMLGENMRAWVGLSPLGTRSYTLDISVAHGDDDLLEDPAATSYSCRNVPSLSQYCGTAQLTVTVFKQL
jgi:prepilin-type N-terminal cleavage/methylation domain-containing protein